MKRRNDFVTNSSSSCYICEISGKDCSGRDISMDDCGMSRCENGHTFMNKFLIGDELTDEQKVEYFVSHYKKEIERYQGYIDNPETAQNSYYKKVENCQYEIDEFNDNIELSKNEDEFFESDEWYDFYFYYDMGEPAHRCPICQLVEIRDCDIMKYTLKKLDVSREDIENEMRSQYKSLKDLK